MVKGQLSAEQTVSVVSRFFLQDKGPLVAFDTVFDALTQMERKPNGSTLRYAVCRNNLNVSRTTSSTRMSAMTRVAFLQCRINNKLEGENELWTVVNLSF